MGWLKLVMETQLQLQHGLALAKRARGKATSSQKTSYSTCKRNDRLLWEGLDILVITTYVVGFINADWLH